MAQPASLTRPLASSSTAPGADLEAGREEEPLWASWARQAAERVRQNAAEAAEQAQRAASEGLERAKSVDWGEKVNQVQTNVSSGLEVVKDRASEASASLSVRVNHGVERARSLDWDEKASDLKRGLSNSFDTVSTSASSATASLAEKGQAGLQATREYSRQSMDSLRETDVVKKAKEGASTVAGAASGVITHAGNSVSSLSALTISPTTWAQFAGVFLVGTLFIMMSLNFLPILLIAPHKFAGLFSFGSVTMLSSFAIFSGPQAFLKSMSQREKVPFSSLYVIGLVGTLWATLVMRSYIFTTVFALVQAVALLYFVASYLPGGKAAVNACCRCSGRSVRSILRI